MRVSLPALVSGIKDLQLKLFLSNKYAYAQIVRMSDGNIVAAASTIEPAARQGLDGSLVDKTACSRYVVHRHSVHCRVLGYLSYRIHPLHRLAHHHHQSHLTTHQPTKT